MDEQRDDEVLALLRERAPLQEHRFTSRVPLIGGVIAAFRTAWNNMSTRWYVAPLIQQQSKFNQLTVERLAQVAARLDSQAEHLATLQDELTKLTHALIEQSNGLHSESESLQELGSSVRKVQGLRTSLHDVQEWLIGQDREQTEIRHDLGELAVRVGQLSRVQEDAGLESNQPSQNDCLSGPV